jgi:hypothetical protein
MEYFYDIKFSTDGGYSVIKYDYENKNVLVTYKVQSGRDGFLHCSCPSRKTCKHIKMVVSLIRKGQAA